MRSSWMFVVAAITAATVDAAPVQPPVQRDDPRDPEAPAAPLKFHTGLDAATPDADVDPAARWREHNDRVRTIGGHAGYLRAGTPAPAEASERAGKR